MYLPKKISIILYIRMNLLFIRDAIISGIIGGTFSYLVSSHHDNIHYLKTIAFLWGLQMVYFYIIFIMLTNHPTIISDFTMHAIAGMVITIIIVGILFVIGDKFNKLTATTAISLVLLFVFIFLYHKYEIYLY